MPAIYVYDSDSSQKKTLKIKYVYSGPISENKAKVKAGYKAPKVSELGFEGKSMRVCNLLSKHNKNGILMTKWAQ